MSIPLRSLPFPAMIALPAAAQEPRPRVGEVTASVVPIDNAPRRIETRARVFVTFALEG